MLQTAGTRRGSQATGCDLSIVDVAPLASRCAACSPASSCSILTPAARRPKHPLQHGEGHAAALLRRSDSGGQQANVGAARQEGPGSSAGAGALLDAARAKAAKQGRRQCALSGPLQPFQCSCPPQQQRSCVEGGSFSRLFPGGLRSKQRRVPTWKNSARLSSALPMPMKRRERSGAWPPSHATCRSSCSALTWWGTSTAASEERLGHRLDRARAERERGLGPAALPESRPCPAGVRWPWFILSPRGAGATHRSPARCPACKHSCRCRAAPGRPIPPPGLHG